MEKITLVAKLTVADGKVDEALAAFDVLIAAADEEPGLEVYSCSQDRENPNVFWFFEVYSNGEALAVHGKGEAMKPAMGALGGLLDGRPEITLMNPVVAKGLDFS